MEARRIIRSLLAFYDDCAGDPTCPPTEDQISFFIGMAAILFVGFWVIAFIVFSFEWTRSAIRKARWDGIVHSATAACKAKTIHGSKGPDTSKDLRSITCSACISALKQSGWDGLVHAQAFHTRYETLCGVKEPDFPVGHNLGIQINWFLDVLDRPSRHSTGDRSNIRQRVTCPQCVEAIRKRYP